MILEPAMTKYKGTTSLTEDHVPESLKDNNRIPVMRRFRNMVKFDQFKVDQELLLEEELGIRNAK